MAAPILTSLRLAHLPPPLAVHVALFREVSNAAFLRQQLLDGNPDFEYAFLDASSILSTTHVLAAVFRAASDMGKGRMKSRNVHSEVVLALSPNNNIAESFRRFGIADQTEDLLVLKLATSAAVTAEGVARHLRAVHGRPVDFSNDRLAETCQLPRIMGIYKIQPLVGGHEPDRATAEAAILGSMALRGAS